ncbi:hypothetical protein M758_4G183000 [Ceratodon purpureus]|nr:hypothetical protein M758_4G183000 [Ceratodon purpureus]
MMMTTMMALVLQLLMAKPDTAPANVYTPGLQRRCNWQRSSEPLATRTLRRLDSATMLSSVHLLTLLLPVGTWSVPYLTTARCLCLSFVLRLKLCTSSAECLVRLATTTKAHGDGFVGGRLWVRWRAVMGLMEDGYGFGGGRLWVWWRTVMGAG